MALDACNCLFIPSESHMDSLFGLSSLGAALPIGTTRTCSEARIPIFHFPPKPAVIAVRKGQRNYDSDSNDGGIEYKNLRELVESRCPSLFTEFHPLWYLFNGHLQTMYCVFGDFSKVDQMWYERKYLRLLDGGTLGLDFAPVDAPRLKDDAPIIVIQHGLTGGSYEPYIRAILPRTCAPVEEGGFGYRAVVVNFRGCAGVPITSQQLYSAGTTNDLRQAVLYITHLYPKAPLHGLGFSLGANVMTKYIAEEGAQTRLLSGCALGCPWDLEKNNLGLLSTFIGKHVYSKALGGNLLNLVKRHQKQLSADPDHRIAKVVPLALALDSPTLEEFDDTFTRVAGGGAPPFPFATAHDYYRWGSSHNVVKDLTVPFLAINAGDDPVVRSAPMDSAGNGLVVMCLTTAGGHLGWFQAGPGYVERWTTKPVLEWLKLVIDDIVQEPRVYPALYVDGDGFLREEGRPSLGCKEVPGGRLMDATRGEEGMLQGL